MAENRSRAKTAKSGAGRRPRRPRVSVSVIGGGKLGAALAFALARTDSHRVAAIVTRTATPAIKLPPSVAALNVARLGELPQSDLFLIATPDDQIGVAARSLARLEHIKPTIALHTSGALSSEELKVLRAAEFAVGSIHPLISVSDARSGSAALARGGVAYCVEGDAKAVRAARLVVRALGGEHFTVEPENKALYHAAAVTSAGHLVALIDAAIEMLGDCGVSERRARALLLPLAASALGNLSTQISARALTGPYARADRDTVRRHVRALEQIGDENARDVYFTLARREVAIAHRRGADRRALIEIESLVRRTKRG